jgi:hypothetical protein
MNTHAIEGITEVVLFGLFLIVLLWQRNRKLTRTRSGRPSSPPWLFRPRPTRLINSVMTYAS